MILIKDFEAFIKLLHRFKVEYMVVGTYAIAFHGKPKYAKSLDIWVDRFEVNIWALLDAIQVFGIPSSKCSKEDFLKPGHIFQIGTPPLSIQIFSAMDSVAFQKAFDNRQSIITGNLEVYYIGLNDLEINKITPGHNQIIADARTIKKILPNTVQRT